jgi:hypothetical protein
MVFSNAGGEMRAPKKPELMMWRFLSRIRRGSALVRGEPPRAPLQLPLPLPLPLPGSKRKRLT